MVPITMCQHEPDPKSIGYDKKHGRKGICIKCGAKIWITKFVQPKKGKNGKST